MIRHGSPTLAGLKTGSLFTCPFAGEQAMRECLRCWNHTLAAKGLRVLIYLYRPARLARDLQRPEARLCWRPGGIAATTPPAAWGG